MVHEDLILTTVNETKMYEAPPTAKWNSNDYCPACRHVRLSIECCMEQFKKMSLCSILHFVYPPSQMSIYHKTSLVHRI
jgi:hypothetical protein